MANDKHQDNDTNIYTKALTVIGTDNLATDQIRLCTRKARDIWAAVSSTLTASHGCIFTTSLDLAREGLWVMKSVGNGTLLWSRVDDENILRLKHQACDQRPLARKKSLLWSFIYDFLALNTRSFIHFCFCFHFSEVDLDIHDHTEYAFQIS